MTTNEDSSTITSTNDDSHGKRIPVNDIINRKNTSTDHASHEEKALSTWMTPLSIRTGNASRPASNAVHHSPDTAPENNEESITILKGSKLDQDEPERNDQFVQSDAELSEVDSTYDDFDDEQDSEEDFGFTFEDEDDDIPIEEDPFFGNTQPEPSPGQPTEEQLEAIRKIMEEDSKKASEDQPPTLEIISPAAAPEKNPPASSHDGIPELIGKLHPLLEEQRDNAQEMVLIIRSSYAGDVFLVVGSIERLYAMKLRFIQTVNLHVEELGTFEFLYGEYAIQDEDTAKELGMGPESYIFCQKVGSLRYDGIYDPVNWPQAIQHEG